MRRTEGAHCVPQRLGARNLLKIVRMAAQRMHIVGSTSTAAVAAGLQLERIRGTALLPTVLLQEVLVAHANERA